MNATIYISDWKLWIKARRFAISNKMSRSQLVEAALRTYMIDYHSSDIDERKIK